MCCVNIQYILQACCLFQSTYFLNQFLFLWFQYVVLSCYQNGWGRARRPYRWVIGTEAGVEIVAGIEIEIEVDIEVEVDIGADIDIDVEVEVEQNW